MPKQKQRNKIVIGLTGNFGSGKSTIARIFSAYGSKIIDADEIAHSCFSRKNKVYKKTISMFGAKILTPDKNIDRHKLARIVFNDKKLLGKLNSIVHPEVIRIIKSKINSKKKGVIVLDAPLLLEAGLRNMVDRLLVAEVTRDTRIKRLLGKRSLSRMDIAKRIRFQIPDNAKARLADFIIDNNGSLAETRKQVKELIMKLTLRPSGLGVNFLPRKKREN
ncbi:MAG: dephospho-CoA kinase [Candidatus Omnitrophota bacterium]|jgi:dephospho-CoA kinase